MARVTSPSGEDLGEVTGAALTYYRREPGYVIDGAAAAAAEGEPEAADAEADEAPRDRRGIFGSSEEPSEDE